MFKYIICLFSFLGVLQLPAGLVINEFMASNYRSFPDSDGDFSDWIELYNTGSEGVNLDGWYLTDDSFVLNKWRFPALEVEPGGFLLVFASGKDRAVAGSELHTNFKLDSSGEYLALIAPDGQTKVSEFTPGFPRQARDVSYGISGRQDELIPEDCIGDILVPPDGSLGLAWTETAFLPGTIWLHGPCSGIGFQTGEVDPHETDALGYWSFDGNTQDETLSSDGVFSGGATPDFVDGFNGAGNGAISFDGVDDYVEIPAGNGFPIYNNNTYSISMWVKGLPQPDFRIFCEGSDTNNTPLFTMGTEHSGSMGTVDIYIRLDSGDAVMNHLNSTGVAFDGQWHHIAWVDENGDARMYIDGVLDETDFSYAKSNITINTTAIACVRRAVPSHFFKGSIDEVAIWDRALNPEEIAELASGTAIGSGPRYGDLVQTDLADSMEGINASAYVRIPFTVEDPLSYDSLIFRVKYEDGFVAYLNGVEVASRNAPGVLQWDSHATAERDSMQAVHFEDINISGDLQILRQGANVLAVHLLNVDRDDNDLLFVPGLSAANSSGTTYSYFPEPTPGAPNGAGLAGFVADTRFSVKRGFFDTPFQLEITTETPGAEIHYTMDGTEPDSSNGILYTGPVTISGTTLVRAAAYADNLLPTNIDTQTYIFLDEVIRQTGAGFPRDWGSHPVVYAMDPNVVNDPAYSDTIKDDLKSIPSLSIVLPVADVFGGAKGIYPNATQRGPAWERKASAELIYPSGADGFQVDCGFQIHGGSSRNWTSTPKHSFSILFKDMYGAGKLRYPLFQDTNVREFDSLVLRACYTDGWDCRNNLPRYYPDDSQFIRDQWMRDMQIAMGWISSHGMYVHLYVDGLYWGLYNVVEHTDDSFAAHYMGGEKEEYDVIKDSELFRGSKSRWNTMIALSKAGLGSESAYERIQEYADIDNLIDYMILHFYGGAEDWAHHNWAAAAKREDGAPFEFFTWDQEIVLDRLDRDYSDEKADDSPAIVHYMLRANPEYRLRFADHVQKLFFNGGLLTPEASTAVYKRRSDEIDRAVVGESAKWGDYRREPPYTRDVEWVTARDWIFDVFFPQRPAIVMNQIKNDHLFPDVSAPVFNQHGGMVDPGFNISMENKNGSGKIYYTFDGSDPREYGTGDVAIGAVEYSEPFEAVGMVEVKARILGNDSEWSALNEAVFRVRRPVDSLCITEIMYNPPRRGEVDGEHYEFIELKNSGDKTIDLSGVTISGAVDFIFPEGVSVSAGEFLVVVSDFDSFKEKYPDVKVVAGEYQKRLSDSGETIRICDPDGVEVFSVSFFDKPPWPFEADGGGYSIVPVDTEASGDPDDALFWRKSSYIGGSPGRDDPENGLNGDGQLPGDYNQDLKVDLSDVVSLLLYLFGGQVDTLPCEGNTAQEGGNLLLLDINGDESVNLSDAVALLSYLFASGPPPVMGTKRVPIEGCPP